MQIVINISEEEYKTFSSLSEKEKINELNYYERIIANGIPLPKGHGRLVDADKLDDTIIQLNEDGWDITRIEYKLIDKAVFELPTVIEADGGDADEDN